MSESKYAATIAALINKAEATDNQHEAEAFMAKAEELMLKHSIDEAMIEAARGNKKSTAEDIVVGKVTLTTKYYQTEMLELGHKVGWGFPVKTLQVRNGSFAMMWYVGHKTDVEYCMTLFRSLETQAERAKNVWWKIEGKHGYYRGDGTIECREFLRGFGNVVGNRLYDMKRRVVEEAGASTDLVLVDRRSRVESWVGENLKVGEARKTQRSQGSFRAQMAGRDAGRNASINKEIN